jgi:hypothetical protein
MTEQEWLGSSDLSAMLHYLHDQTATIRTRWQGPFRVRQWRTSERKLRLFACGCCRYVSLWLCSGAAQANLLREIVGNPFAPAGEKRPLSGVLGDRFIDGEGVIAGKEDIASRHSSLLVDRAKRSNSGLGAMPGGAS